MLSLRYFARSLPRATRLIYPPFGRRNLGIAIIQSSPLRQPWRRTFTPVALYTTSSGEPGSDGTVNGELALKLASELNIEKEMDKAYPEDVQEYIENSSFKLHDTLGQEEVILTRQFGDESIRVSFSIADLDQSDQDLDGQMEDDSMMDEMEDPSGIPSDIQSGGSRSQGAINQARKSGENFKTAPEDSIAASDIEGDEGTQDQQSFPATVEVTVERPGKGALQIYAVAQDGLFMIDKVSYYENGKQATAKTPDEEFSARELYTGPQFANLDEDLQILFERYLDERGIDVGMATFVPNYIEWKEQAEYTRWLENVKGFME